MDTNNKTYAKGIDWAYLFFLFLITNQAMISLKVLGILFIFAIRPNFRFGFAEGRIPKFYPYILLLSLVSLFVHIKDFSSNYLVAFLVGNLYWLFGLLTFHQTRISLEKYGPVGMNKLLKAFSLLNLAFSFYQLVKIMLITGKFNPYSKLPFPYGMSTGDNIYGFFMESSYYNMMVSAVLAVYFLYKRNIFFALVSVTTLMLVFGNFGTLIFMAILAGMLVCGMLSSMINPRQGTLLYNVTPPGRFGLYIPGVFVYILFFFVFMSPENMEYVVDKVKSKVFSVDGSANNYRNIMKNNPKPRPEAYDLDAEHTEVVIGSAPTYSLGEQGSFLGTQSTPLDARKKMSEDYLYKLQGKALSIKETSQYLQSSTGNFLFGAGTARFSSITAQKMGGFDSSRIFMNVLPRFTSPDYAQNHKLLVQARYDLPNEYRSNANWPDSVYNHIVGEYGVLGAAIFILFYLGYFLKRAKYYSYSLWIFAMMIPFATLSYMFEALSIIVFFELLAITNVEETKQMNHVIEKQ